MTWIFLWDSEPSKIFVGDTEVSSVWVWDTKVRPTEAEPVCFTAIQAWAQVRIITWAWYPPALQIEYSTDWETYTSYTENNWITLSAIWDKVYFRSSNTTDRAFSTWYSAYHKFEISTWKVNCSWNITSLINKNWTNTVWDSGFSRVFSGCNMLVSCPSFPATNLWEQSYNGMFYLCSNLETIPAFPSTWELKYRCYWWMFYWCSKIKVSETQTWEYQTPYRIPTSWTGSTTARWMEDMFVGSWWSFTWTPTINTTYYTSNTIV